MGIMMWMMTLCLDFARTAGFETAVVLSHYRQLLNRGRPRQITLITCKPIWDHLILARTQGHQPFHRRIKPQHTSSNYPDNLRANLSQTTLNHPGQNYTTVIGALKSNVRSLWSYFYRPRFCQILLIETSLGTKSSKDSGTRKPWLLVIRDWGSELFRSSRRVELEQFRVTPPAAAVWGRSYCRDRDAIVR